MKKFRIVAAVVAVALGATWALAYNEISPGLAALLAAYAPLSGATFTGTVALPSINVSSLPLCTPGSSVAPVPTGYAFSCSGVILIAQ